jgi:hypothetical protein
MTAVGIWFMGIGLADLVAGLSGEPARGSRAGMAVGAAFASSFVLALVFGLAALPAALLAVLTGGSVAGWIVARSRDRLSEGRASIALLYLLLVFVAIAGTASLWPAATDSLAGRAIARLPFSRLASAPAEQAALVAGVVLFLFATSNAIVRLVLTAVGTKFSPAEQRLRGGRIIGPIERLLILGLGLAGEPTAAALVISAKGLLRYPELVGMRSEPGSSSRTIDVVTEYLLIGSLTSWTLALFPLVLVSR